MKLLARVALAVLLFADFGFLAAAETSQGRSADQILKEIDSIKLPSQDVAKRNDRAYFREFLAKRMAVMDKKSVLILELYKTAPGDPHLATLLPERWSVQRLATDATLADKLIAEIDEVLSRTGDEKLKIDGVYHKARAKLFKSRASDSLDLSGIHEFFKIAPAEGARGGNLFTTAFGIARDAKTKVALEEAIIRDFPETQYAARLVGVRRRRESSERPLDGKAIDLEFADATTGSHISIKKFRGKVVVLDFWATWCKPCVEEIPKMKELYSKFHDQGVEFIGVSLDKPEEQGGLDQLKVFVKEKGISWPQYYQGKGWESEFSTSWGIDAIPAVFLIDPAGKLYSLDARKKLDVLIPELVQKLPRPKSGE